MTWTDEIGPWDFTPSVVKNQYNEGNLISDSTDPIWSTAHTGVPITETHDPCGYWPLGYSEPVVPPPPSVFSIYSCGNNSNRELMRTTTGIQHQSYDTIDMGNISSYAGGSSCSFLIDEDGALWGIGANGNGCLGMGHSTAVTELTSIFSSGISFCHLSNDTGAGFIVKTDGTLWASGYNNQGQLGLGDKVNRNTFEQVGVATDWVSVWCTYYVTYGLKTNGDIWSWGYGAYNATGHGDSTQRSNPEKVIALSNIVTYKVGYFCAFAIDTSGVLWVVGANPSGNLALNDTVNRTVFTQKSDGTWKDVCPAQSTYFHTMLIDTNGNLYGVGANAQGQLGLGDTIAVNQVTQVGTDSDWESVTCGSTHSIALKTTGGLYGSGSNLNGVLGLGDTTARLSFELADTGYYSVQTNALHTLAAKEI